MSTSVIIIIVLIIIGIGAVTGMWRVFHEFFFHFIKEIIGLAFAIFCFVLIWKLIWADARPGENQPYIDYIKGKHGVANDIPSGENSQRRADSNRRNSQYP